MELNEVLSLVKKELEAKLNKKNIKDYDTVDIETAVDLLESEGLPVYSDFRDKLVSPWAIAKYIQLSLEEKELIEKVKKDLVEFVPDFIDIAFMKKFSCIVQLSRKFVEGEKQQAISLKYFLDDDDNIQYKITSTSTWCWDISKRQLIALLKNEIMLPEGSRKDWKIEKKSWFRRIFHT